MTTALIFGVGRTGGYAAARAAVHSMDVILVDDDKFETHNFEEHFLRDERLLDTSKAVALADTLGREFPALAFHAIPRNVYALRHEIVADLIAEADMVLTCTGDPEANKYICSLARNKPVIVTGVYADDEDLRGFVFVSRGDGMCLWCWDEREERRGRHRGEPYNFRQTAATAVDIGAWIVDGLRPPELCLLQRSEGEALTAFRWVRGERNPDCRQHASTPRTDIASDYTEPLRRIIDRRARPPRLPWWSVLRLLPALVLFEALGPERRSIVVSAVVHFVEVAVTLARRLG